MPYEEKKKSDTVNIVIAESRLHSNLWVALKRAILGVLVRYTLSYHGTVPSEEKKYVKASRNLMASFTELAALPRPGSGSTSPTGTFPLNALGGVVLCRKKKKENTGSLHTLLRNFYVDLEGRL